jgi:hypothetical protein
MTDQRSNQLLDDATRGASEIYLTRSYANDDSAGKRAVRFQATDI